MIVVFSLVCVLVQADNKDGRAGPILAYSSTK